MRYTRHPLSANIISTELKSHTHKLLLGQVKGAPFKSRTQEIVSIKPQLLADLDYQRNAHQLLTTILWKFKSLYEKIYKGDDQRVNQRVLDSFEEAR